MKKIVIGLIAFAMVAMTGSALAWDIGVTIGVEDAKVDITATATDDDYILAASAGVDGTGDICIQGEGDSDGGYLITGVSGRGELYAAQGLGIAGCLIECTEEPCDECPDYLYIAEINKNKLYNLITDKKNLIDKFKSIHNLLRYLKNNYSGIIYKIGKLKIVCLFKKIKPNKKNRRK